MAGPSGGNTAGAFLSGLFEAGRERADKAKAEQTKQRDDEIAMYKDAVKQALQQGDTARAQIAMQKIDELYKLPKGKSPFGKLGEFLQKVGHKKNESTQGSPAGTPAAPQASTQPTGRGPGAAKPLPALDAAGGPKGDSTAAQPNQPAGAPAGSPTPAPAPGPGKATGKLVTKAFGKAVRGLGTGMTAISDTLSPKPTPLPALDAAAFPVGLTPEQAETQKLKFEQQEAIAKRGISEADLQAEQTQAEKALGRKLTDDEKLQMLKLTPKFTGGVIWGTDASGNLVPMKDVGGKLQPLGTPEGVTPVPLNTLPTEHTSGSTYDPNTGTTHTSSTSQKVVPRTAGTKKQLPGNPSGRFAPKSAPASSPVGRVKAMADDWARSGTVPGVKDRPAVEQYMADHGIEPGYKPTQAEIKLRDDLKKVEPMVDRLDKFLTDNKLTEAGQGGMFSFSAMQERGRVQKAWEEYSHGLPPSDKQLGELIKMAAAVKIMGAAPWMTIGRGRYLFAEIVKHLPNETDTPAQLYEKVQFYRSILKDAKASLPPSLQDSNETSGRWRPGMTPLDRGRGTADDPIVISPQQMNAH